MEPREDDVRDATLEERISAYVFSLVSAIGGSSAEEDGRYRTGEDAIQCLRDLRKVITAYDVKPGRLDVARAAAESNLVKGDLLAILGQWSGDTDELFNHKIVIASLEILVHLTWPFEIDAEDMTYNHHRHLPYLLLAQADYKRAILQHPTARILNSAIRAALPSMAETRKERSIRDEMVIKIVLCLLRNVAAISQPGKTIDFEDAEISRSATIDAFHQQDAFQVLLTLSSSMGDDFVSQDVIILETLFHLLKGIDVEKLFMEEQKLTSENTKDFKALLNKEKAMLAGYARHAPSRHNRFGTMIWVKRDDHKVSTVSGQDVLGHAQTSLQKMDKTKKWNKPKYRGRKTEGPEKEHTEFDKATHIDSTARKNLRAFVEEFLDSSFNPLFAHLRKAIEREESRVERRHSAQFFYVMSWFLRAECIRRRKVKEKRERTKGVDSAANAEDESFGLIAAVMTQETFVLLNRFMERSQEDKTWTDVKAGMRAFTQILLTVQEMSESPLEDDQDIAENILTRIFYEETTHDRIISLLRGYKQQGFGYLDAVTELAHVFLRMLERFSKQNVDLQVRSKRRARKKKRQADGEIEGEAAADQAEEAEDVAEAQRTVSERKFDFTRFAARFMNQSSVDTFISFLRYYNDLSDEQLKRAHRFLYRLAFKMELGVMLYRVDILHLFNKMIKGPEGLNSDLPQYKEWEELVKQVFRRVVKKIQERPELVVEMLFSKLPATMFYLEHGYEKERITRAPRPPAELEVRPGMEKPEEIGVAVSVLLNQDKADALQWVKDALQSAAEERKAWEDSEAARKAKARAAIPTDDLDELLAESERPAEESADAQPQSPSITLKPDSPERQMSLFKDSKLRLLLKLLGFNLTSESTSPDATWTIPSNLDSAELAGALETIRKYERDPPTFEDGKTAESFLRSKAAAARTSARRKVEYDDDSDGSIGDEEFLFPAGGPSETKSKHEALAELKKKRRKRRRQEEGDEIDEEVLKARRKKRREAEREKARKVKSEMYVGDSDADNNEEYNEIFFGNERAMRDRTAANNTRAMQIGKTVEAMKKHDARGAKANREDHDESENGDASSVGPAPSSRKRKSTSVIDIDSDSESDTVPPTATRTRKRRKTPRSSLPDASDSDDSASAVSTAVSHTSPAHPAASTRKCLTKAPHKALIFADSSDEDDDVQDTPMSSNPAVGRPGVSSDKENGIKEMEGAEDVDVTMRDVRADGDEEDEEVTVKRAAPMARRSVFIMGDSDEE